MKAALALALGIFCGTALADARVQSVTAKQAKPLEAIITVLIERPTPLDQYCDAVVDLGDGTSQTLKYGIGDKHAKSLKHKYAKAGTYKIAVRGTGKCGGSHEASVTVSDKGAATAEKASKPACPRGWSVAADSVHDSRYTCYANPPTKPLACGGGTKYFYEKGVMGCR